jgi:general secretion pathway protein J
VRSPGTTPHHAAGFTLIELLIALAIFAVVAVLAYGGLNSVLNQRRGIEDRLGRIAMLQKAYMRMRGDFQQVRNRPVRDPYGDQLPALYVTPTAPVLEFTRGGWRNPMFQPRATEERVSYRLADGKLLRDSWRVLDRVQGSEPIELVVLENVDELAWRFFAPDGTWAQDWPPPSQLGQQSTQVPPPSAIEITMKTREWGDLRFLFRTGIDCVKNTATGTCQ